MKDNIKTAEEIYVEYFGSVNTTTRKSTSKHNIIEAMKEYASQFIALAAEEARFDIIYHALGEDYFVNKESILKVKQLIK